MQYPAVLNPAKVGNYPRKSCFPAVGFVWDAVLEYRVVPPGTRRPQPDRQQHS